LNPNSDVCSLMSRNTNEVAASPMALTASSTTAAGPARRSSGARSATPMTVAPTKFRTKSVPIVGTAE
jgi:hypothetical protein